MLQRAASNAYSWWWASHIRTKQSKWLEQNLQDMDDKVQTVLKLIDEDGDSFAKRAEMYYKKRPEITNFVEESYRAYRSLAERYDHISTELQNANSTIASVFPERAQFPMDDEDEYDNSSPRFPKGIPNPSMANNNTNNNNIPKVPTTPTRDMKGLLRSATKKLKTNNISKAEGKNVVKSGLSKTEAIGEIDKLQKDILSLQTVKEFVKISYDSGINNYREIENQITELQERVIVLEDEFKLGIIIEDDEARTVMAKAALKSCGDTLVKLHEKQEISSEKARTEGERVGNAREKLMFLKKKFLPDHQDEKVAAEEKDKDKENKKDEAKKEKEGTTKVEILEKKKIEEVSLKGPLTVTELVEKIDDLVDEVISLETAVFSQTATVDRLRAETDDLQAQVRALEDDKVTLVDDKYSLTDKLRELEEKLNGLQKLNENVENENKDLKAHFTGAHSSHDFLADNLSSVKPDEEVEQKEPTPKAGEKKLKKLEKIDSKVEGPKQDKHDLNTSADKQREKEKEEQNKGLKQDDSISPAMKVDRQIPDFMFDNQAEKRELIQEGLRSAGTTQNDKQVHIISDENQSESGKEKISQIVITNEKDAASSRKPKFWETEAESSKDGPVQNQDKIVINESIKIVNREEDEMNWQEMLLNGLEDREKVLLGEYTAILRNYKDVKRKLSDVEKQKEDSLFEMTLQLSEHKAAVSKRDQEIRSLRQKLNLLQEDPEEIKDLEEISSPQSEEVVKWMLIEQSRSISPIEERLRTEIDALLDQNLDFWLRFSTSFHQIQKYRNGYEDLLAEIMKVKEQGKSKRESSVQIDIKSELRPIYRHLTEIQTELNVWVDQSALLTDELERRFSSLCNIQEEITRALKAGAEEEEMRFTSHEAAKLQGEVVNMKQENNRVRDELEAGLEHVNMLQREIKKTVADLIDELGLSGQRTNSTRFRHSTSRPRVPLQSFIFGTKEKKKSIFNRINLEKSQELKGEISKGST